MKAQASFVAEYVVRTTGRPRELTIFSGEGREVGKLELGAKSLLTDPGGRGWVLDPHDSGEMEPFSLKVRNVPREDRAREKGAAMLTIRRGLFVHKGKFYLFSGIAAGRDPKEFMLGSRFVCRLENFPFAGIQEVDLETLGKLRRYYRGPVVGEVSGLGSQGHIVRLSEELSDIALVLAASSYILYSSA
jgi:hypothetical protein